MTTQPEWYACSTGETARMTATTPDGLTAAEASRRLSGDGPSVLPKGEAEGPWVLLWRQINNQLIWVLIGSAALALALGKGSTPAWSWASSS